MTLALPPACERALLERFLRAEAMAMYSVRSAQHDVPPHVLEFLRRHEAEEEKHLRQFEGLTGIQAIEKTRLPKLPKQWYARAVHLYGYEALGLEFARLLAALRPDLGGILEDEEGHVAFFEAEIRRIVAEGRGPANGAREYARGWLRRLSRTVGRYVGSPDLEPYRDALADHILKAIESRFTSLGLISAVLDV